MTTKPNILVTSAAGKTGLATTLHLLDMGYPVRAFVRRRDQRSARLADAGAQIFLGDQFALDDMRRAMAGMQRAYHCPPTAPHGLHFTAIFATAAAEARLEHIVSMGQWLASARHPSLFTRETRLGDHLLGNLPDTTLTINNTGWFADNYLMVLDLAADLGIFAMPLGAGDTPKNAPPSTEDIARVNAAALADPATHAGRTYRATGPKLISPNQIAAAMGTALGRKVRYMALSERMFLKALRANPPANFSAAAASQLLIYTREYRRGAFAHGAPTSAVTDLSGRPPEPFEAIVTRAVRHRGLTRRSAGRRAAAMAGFARMLLTPPLNPVRIEAQRDYPQLETPAFVLDDPTWRDTHPTGPTGAPIKKVA